MRALAEERLHQLELLLLLQDDLQVLRALQVRALHQRLLLVLLEGCLGVRERTGIEALPMLSEAGQAACPDLVVAQRLAQP